MFTGDRRGLTGEEVKGHLSKSWIDSVIVLPILNNIHVWHCNLWKITKVVWKRKILMIYLCLKLKKKKLIRKKLNPSILQPNPPHHVQPVLDSVDQSLLGKILMFMGAQILLASLSIMQDEFPSNLPSAFNQLHYFYIRGCKCTVF